jgi:hypothetical protein
MDKITAEPSNVIDQMVALRLQLAQLESQVEALKPAFFDACATQGAAQFQHEQAVIFRRLTPGKWDYPSNIIEQEEQIKQLKQQFQQTHEPVTGLEMTGSIKLTPQL